MKPVVAFSLLALLLCLILTGCQPPPPVPVAGGGPPAPPAPPAAPQAPVVAPPVETEQVKAEQGVGIKGRSLDEYEGVVVTPAKTLFAVRERIAFEIEVPQALAFFNAMEGRNPESHEEFMEKIIEFNKIELPKLPPGHKYLYDPERNELMVERPKLKSE